MRYGDYIVVNLSSPNTPGLRDLQKREAMESLLTRVKAARDQVHQETLSKNIVFTLGDDTPAPTATPLLVKISPDLSRSDLKSVAEVALSVGVDGIICSNTTVARPASLEGKAKDEKGGLSGEALF